MNQPSLRPTLSPAAFAQSIGDASMPADPPLMAMLYGSVLRLVGEADRAFAQKDHERARDRICRAIAVMDELALTFEPGCALEIIEGLLSLYRFCKQRLFEANQFRDRQALADVVSAIGPLHLAWARLDP